MSWRNAKLRDIPAFKSILTGFLIFEFAFLSLILHGISHDGPRSLTILLSIVFMSFMNSAIFPRMIIVMLAPDVRINDKVNWRREFGSGMEDIPYIEIENRSKKDAFEVRVYVEEVKNDEKTFVRRIAEATFAKIPARLGNEKSCVEVDISSAIKEGIKEKGNVVRITVSYVTRMFNVKEFTSETVDLGKYVKVKERDKRYAVDLLYEDRC